jgi:hypothetical protein
VLPDVDVFVVIDVGTWFYNASMHLVLCAIEVSSYRLLNSMCRVVDIVL